jgi:hypothetical protein
MPIYIYGSDLCVNCRTRKQQLEQQGVPFVMRPIERLQNEFLASGEVDEIDVQALAALAMGDYELPVEVQVPDG